MEAITDGQGIESKILTIRGVKVIIDRDLAELYGVETRAFNQAVKRNIERFPSDFMFQLGREELAGLMSQIVISSSSHGGVRKLPYVFTEHGAIMAASILNSRRAVEMSVQVVRAFVRMRQMLSTVKALSGKLEELETRLDIHDDEIGTIMKAIRQLMAPAPAPSKKKIGFHAKDDEVKS